MFWALIVGKKKTLYWRPKHWILNLPLTCCRLIALFGTNLHEITFILEIVKRTLYLGYVLLLYVLIYILEAWFHFNLIFLQLNVIKMFTAQSKLVFPLLPAICFEVPITRIFFDFPWRFKSSGVDCISFVMVNRICLSMHPRNFLP